MEVTLVATGEVSKLSAPWGVPLAATESRSVALGVARAPAAGAPHSRVMPVRGARLGGGGY